MAKTQVAPAPAPVKAADEYLDEVRRTVLAEKGKPNNFDHAEARHLWGDKYRVNVFVEDGNRDSVVRSVRILNSYFVQRANGEYIIK